MINYDYLYTLVRSAALELITYLIVMPMVLKSLYDRKRLLEVILPINAITHAIFFFVIMGLPLNFISNILLGESVVIIIEAWFLAKIFSLRFPKAFGLSFIANLVSWQLGPILTYFIKS